MSATHDHDHDHGSGHSHAPDVTSQNERVVLIGFLLTFGFMFAEIIGGILSGSLALIADAGHMLTDAAALALAWAGFRFGRRAADSKRTFGYMRFEVLAGFVNAVALMLLVAWIAWEAVLRLLNPAPVLAGPMMLVAALGLAVNCGVFYMLMQGDRQHVNLKGALLHVMGDLLGSVAALASGIVILYTGWTPIDPLLTMLICGLILFSTLSLLRQVLNTLLEGVPDGLSLPEVGQAMAEVRQVRSVHDLHIWSLDSRRTALSAHVVLDDAAHWPAALGALRTLLRTRFGIEHVTLQPELPPAQPLVFVPRRQAETRANTGIRGR